MTNFVTFQLHLLPVKYVASVKSFSGRNMTPKIQLYLYDMLWFFQCKKPPQTPVLPTTQECLQEGLFRSLNRLASFCSGMMILLII